MLVIYYIYIYIYIYIIHIPSCCAISIRKNWWSTTNNWGFFKGVGLVENRNTQCTHTRTSFYARDIFSCTYTHTSCYATDAICFTYSHTSCVATYIFSCTYPHTWCYARDIFSCTYIHISLRYKGFFVAHTHILPATLGTSFLAHTQGGKHVVLWRSFAL